MAGRRDASDTARQIGLYGSGAVPQQPMSSQQPISGPRSHSPHNVYPQQPNSAPHPSLSTPQDPYASIDRHSGSRCVSNPTREAIAQLIEGTEAKSSGGSRSGGSVQSIPSHHSIASFDPSTVTDERSWDSAGSFVRPGTASLLFLQQSAESLQAGVHRQGAVRNTHSTYSSDGSQREHLPLELRTFGAPPEYSEVMRSPPSSQPGSGVHLGAERYRRSEVATPTTYSMPAHQRAPTSHGEDPALAAIMRTASAMAPGSSRDLHLDFGAAASESPRSSGRSATDGEGGPSESMAGGGGDDSDSQKRSILSDAVIRKLKLKNQQLEKDLREKKKQIEEMTKSVVSWKKSIKDRQVARIEEGEALFKEKLQRAYNSSRKLKVKLIASVCRRHAALTRAAVMGQWHEQTTAGKLKTKLKESEDRCAGSELMVAFLKEQLATTGLVPQALPQNAHEHDAGKANAALDWLLSQIPSGVVGEYDIDSALAHARSAPQPGASELLAKIEMVWAEVRELVATSSAARQSTDAAPPASGVVCFFVGVFVFVCVCVCEFVTNYTQLLTDAAPPS